MSGWIKLHRKFLKWEWYTKDNMAHFFLHLLLSANHKETKWRGIVVGRGQLLTGRKQLAESTGLSERSVRTCLNLLKSTNEVTIKTTSKYSVITIVNYDLYQDSDDESTIKTTSNQSVGRPSTDQVATTSKNDKNDNNGKKERSETRAHEILINDEIRYEVFQKSYRSEIPDWNDLLHQFSNKVDIEQLEWEPKILWARADNFARNWIKNQRDSKKLTKAEQRERDIADRGGTLEDYERNR